MQFAMGDDLRRAYLFALTSEELAELGQTGASPGPIVRTEGPQYLADVSPDGRWLAFSSSATGRLEAYLVPMDGGGAPVLLSSDGGETPIWSPDGRSIFYRDGQRFYRMPIPAPGEAAPGPPELYLRGDFVNVAGAEMSVANDGRRLLPLQGSGERGTTTLNVITNWTDRVAELIGG